MAGRPENGDWRLKTEDRRKSGGQSMRQGEWRPENEDRGIGHGEKA